MNTPAYPRHWAEMVEQLHRQPEWAVEQIKHTHISVILLGRDRVLKLKKPVNFGFLDYSTLSKRQQACEAEVLLNRRLSPEIYLGVEPVRESTEGAKLGGSGSIVDYGVLMRRLQADRMLDELLRQGKVTEDVISEIAQIMAKFHQSARRGPEVDTHGEIASILHNWNENFEQAEGYLGKTIEPSTFEFTRNWTREQMERDRSFFEDRIRSGRIVDGHGDLRCESINVDDQIHIFDCVEFSDRLRCGDIASEVAFLAMDLDARGRPDLGYYFVEQYQKQANDEGLFRLQPFYRCYRAFVRGKVSSFRLDEPDFNKKEQEEAKAEASKYFKLAHRYADRLKRPAVVVVVGLSGSGKTSIARAIAGELGLRVVSTDEVRHELFGKGKARAEFQEGAYGSRETQLTYKSLFAQGQDLVSADGGVVFDGTFISDLHREGIRLFAQMTGADLKVVECDLPPEVIRRRITRRQARQEGKSDADWEIYLRQREGYRPWQSPSLRLDTSGDLSDTSHRATDWIREPSRTG